MPFLSLTKLKHMPQSHLVACPETDLPKLSKKCLFEGGLFELGFRQCPDAVVRAIATLSYVCTYLCTRVRACVYICAHVCLSVCTYGGTPPPCFSHTTDVLKNPGLGL